MDYQCSFCEYKFKNFKDVIKHTCDNHQNERLKYSFIVLNSENGKRKLCTKVFNFSPKECEDKGVEINVTNENTVILVTKEKQNEKSNTPIDEHSEREQVIISKHELNQKEQTKGDDGHEKRKRIRTQQLTTQKHESNEKEPTKKHHKKRKRRKKAPRSQNSSESSIGSITASFESSSEEREDISYFLKKILKRCTLN